MYTCVSGVRFTHINKKGAKRKSKLYTEQQSRYLPPACRPLCDLSRAIYLKFNETIENAQLLQTCSSFKPASAFYLAGHSGRDLLQVVRVP